MKENRFQQKTVSSVFLGMVLVCLPALGAGMGDVSVTVREPGVSATLPCRVWVSVGGKRLFEPESGSGTSYVKDRSFSCDGRFVMKVPVGKAVIHVERGKEYLPVDRQVQISSGQTLEVEIELQRWVNMAERNWYSGDFHCNLQCSS